MRFVTFFGLIMIAKCIDPVRISDGANVYVTILVISLIVDVIDLIRKWMK